MRRLLWIGTAACWAAVPLSAQEAFLTLPLDCEPGLTCYIEDYVDGDPGPGYRDYACGLKTRDGHRGTDFALITQQQFEAGVDVLAAAAGIVEATRDGVPDLPYSPEMADALEGRECGNAVRIRHDNGYQTLYCHLRQRSVTVRRGDTVARGSVLGQVGMSGESNYPHVHISVLGPDGHQDPFFPGQAGTCGEPAENLWLTPLPYTKTGMFTAGFSDRVPAFADVKSGTARLQEGSSDAPMVLYSHFYYAQDGDVLNLRVEGPDGEIFENTDRLETPKISQFRAYGKKSPAGGWPAGVYRGRATLKREGKVLAVRFTEITIR